MSLERFEAFCRAVGLELEPFQHEIVDEVFGGRRELLCLLPRGNGKSSLLAAVALFHLLTTPNPAAYVCAASREQASVLFDIARTMAVSDPGIERRVEITRREIRTAGGFLKVISSDAPRQHGLIPSLAIIDELHAHPNDELYIAMSTAMMKRPGAKLITISTAGTGPESALGRLRTRALALPSVERSGALTRAYGPNFAMLDWSVADDADIEDAAVVKEANPASWITEQALGGSAKRFPSSPIGGFMQTSGPAESAHGSLPAPGSVAPARPSSRTGSGSGSASTSAGAGQTRRSSGSMSGCTSALRSSRARTP